MEMHIIDLQVDPDRDGCADYLEIIDHPLDLGTIEWALVASNTKLWQ